MTRRHILVVDDDALVGRSIVRVLTGQGYDATHRVRVADAIEILDATGDAGGVDLVLIDVNLGFGPNGCTVAKTIAHRWPTIRTAAMSGDRRVDHAVTCPDGLPFLQKPFDYTAIRAILDAPPYAPLPELPA